MLCFHSFLYSHMPKSYLQYNNKYICHGFNIPQQFFAAPFPKWSSIQSRYVYDEVVDGDGVLCMTKGSRIFIWNIVFLHCSKQINSGTDNVFMEKIFIIATKLIDAFAKTKLELILTVVLGACQNNWDKWL